MKRTHKVVGKEHEVLKTFVTTGPNDVILHLEELILIDKIWYVIRHIGHDINESGGKVEHITYYYVLDKSRAEDAHITKAKLKAKQEVVPLFPNR